MIRTAVIGVGNMGSRYAALLQEKSVDGMELCALTRIGSAYREALQQSVEQGVPVYAGAEELFQAVEAGELQLDAVIIATPHPAHEEITVRAFRNGLHVLCDKPSGVSSGQAGRMEAAADSSGKVFGMVFNQRTMPVYRKIKELVSSGVYGSLKRMNWVVTDWYRPEAYYHSGAWRATWDRDGGGVLLNQCPHNLDLLQWICGMPSRVQGFCKEGHYHHIVVEDAATAYMEWENGAIGTFITSTGEAPGVNRLEIALEEALLVCENSVLRIGDIRGELGCREAEYRRTSGDHFRKIRGEWTEWQPPVEEQPYQKVLQAFADEILGRGKCVADGREGRKSLLLSNAIYLSSWEKRMVEIPLPGSAAEMDFETLFESHLRRKQDSRP
ncbi:MAG: Gfo/Idh/MocA family oxidoreductase [Lachnospiraceae bacterium]|nr:Gfo/Idh/MocA family oxidoreductase [Lachnospiraceae bacterium]